MTTADIGSLTRRLADDRAGVLSRDAAMTVYPTETRTEPRAVDHRPDAGRERPTTLGLPNMGVSNNQALNGTATVAIPGLLPSQVFERTRWQRRYAAYLRLTDAVVICGAIVIAQYVRFGPTLSPPGYLSNYVPAFSALFAIVWLSALAGLHSRSPRLVGIGLEEYRRVIAASFWTFGTIAIVTMLLKVDIARGYLAVALPGGVLALVLSRWAWRAFLARKHAEGGYQTAVLAIGERDAVEDLAKELTRNPTDGYQVVGIGIPGYGPPRGEHLSINDRMIPIVGGEIESFEAIRTCGADTVAIAGTQHFGLRGIRRLLWDLEPMGVDLLVSTGVTDIALARLVMRPIAGLPLLHVDKPQYRGAKRFEKRAFDFCFSLAVLTVTLPVLVLIAIAIKLSSRGPVFYSSERIGIDGKPFAMLKFRTMFADADKQLAHLLDANESDGLLFKIRNDPRITPVGSLLRRFSIDELPQFINVLRDEMSVVGPRPPLRREVEAYDCEVLRRLLVKPGITGLWQVSGRSDISWSEAVRLDLSYVDNWSMVTDIMIIAKTLKAVLQRTGAY
jgi:exopolysaccharide biosynthesis polyprenyl glycosylphosphotransferase